MNLEYELTYRADLRAPLAVGNGPYGTRMVVEVIGGRVEGKRLNGKILSGGGDWLLVGPDGFGRLDVRAQFVTDDGAALYLQYQGIGALIMGPRCPANNARTCRCLAPAFIPGNVLQSVVAEAGQPE